MPAPRPSTAASVSVVVPTWNGADLLAGCLDALAAQTVDAHVVVVDNGSVDGTRELLDARHHGVEVVRLPENRGFAGGVNAGIAVALERGSGWVALVNNDGLADPGWLEHLLRTAAAHPRAGIVTGKLLFADGRRIECAGECMSTWGMPYSRGRGEPDSGQYEVTEQVFAGSGGSMLLSAAMLGDVGVFDENLFAYLEDVDLSFRARLRGWEVWYAPSAVVRHEVGATSSRVPGFTYRQTLRNMVVVYLKDMPASLAWRHLPRFVAEWWLIAASGLRRRQLRAFATAVAGVARLLLPTWRARRSVQARRTVRPAAIARQLTPGLVPGQLDAIAASLPLVSRVRGGGPPRAAR